MKNMAELDWKYTLTNLTTVEWRKYLQFDEELEIKETPSFNYLCFTLPSSATAEEEIKEKSFRIDKSKY